jgi:hypothetical protein
MKMNNQTKIKMKALAHNTYIGQVKVWLESGMTITPRQAFRELGCTRLSAVIFRLINEYNMPIVTNLIPVKNGNGRWTKVAQYKLVKDEEND